MSTVVDKLTSTAINLGRAIEPRNHSLLVSRAFDAIEAIEDAKVELLAGYRLAEACENLILAYGVQSHESMRPDWLRDMLRPIRRELAGDKAPGREGSDANR